MVSLMNTFSRLRPLRRHLPYPHRLLLPFRGLCMITATAILLTGCATVAQATNLSEARCDTSFETGLSSILIEQGEEKDVPDMLAHRAYLVLSITELGSRPFLVSSPCGTDYSLFIEKKNDRCLLHLYGRQKGFMSYTNNLTYISTHELPYCSCRE